MRADTHYVEQLDTDQSRTRPLDRGAVIDVRGDEPRLAAPFVDSVRRHGILQPILVQPRGNRFRLIAGRKRLAAAQAAGVREVPCLVQRVDEDQANLLADAANTPAQETDRRPRFGAPMAPRARRWPTRARPPTNWRRR